MPCSEPCLSVYLSGSNADMAEADFNGIENEVSLYIERADYEGLIVRFIYFNYFSIQTKFNMTSAIVDCFQLYKLNGW